MIGIEGRPVRGPLARLAVVGLCAGVIAGCASAGFEQDYLEPSNSAREPPRYTSEGPEETVFGPGGFDFLEGFGSNNKGGGGGAGIGVNSFLWRATLDTVSFMPLTSADPFGGVIITDWYTPAETPRERFKVNLYILGQQLRADGVRAAVFRQRRDGDGSWIDAPVEAKTATNLENAILARARQLRINSTVQ